MSSLVMNILYGRAEGEEFLLYRLDPRDRIRVIRRPGLARGSGWCCRGSGKHDIDPAGLHHPFETVIAIFAPPLAGGIGAGGFAHAGCRCIELSEPAACRTVAGPAFS
jgi:hypothetical protein